MDLFFLQIVTIESILVAQGMDFFIQKIMAILKKKAYISALLRWFFTLFFELCRYEKMLDRAAIDFMFLGVFYVPTDSNLQYHLTLRHTGSPDFARSRHWH
jgi:hypothetical protein